MPVSRVTYGDSRSFTEQPALLLTCVAAGPEVAVTTFDGRWWARVSWVHEAGGRRDHKVVLVRASSLRPLEPPEVCKTVPRRGAWPRRADPQPIPPMPASVLRGQVPWAGDSPQMDDPGVGVAAGNWV